jgi:hypothetical protein
MQFRLKVLLPGLLGIVALLPTAAFAQQAPPPIVQQQSQQVFCGDQSLEVMRGDQIMGAQPDEVGLADQNVIDISAVQGRIVYREGPMVLLQLDTPGIGNAGPRHELAGDDFAVVRLPTGCTSPQFGVGTGILAFGTPNGKGVLEATAVTEATA